MESTAADAGPGLYHCARPDRADHAARRASVLSGDPGGEGGARPVRRPRAAHLQHRAVRHGLRHLVLRLAVGSLRPASGAAVGAGAVPVRQRRFADGGNRECAGAGAAGAGDRRRLRADARSRDRARRLPRRATRQGDRLSDHVRHARADDLADHRRRADRHARLAQRVRLRAPGRRRHHAHRLSGDVRDPSGRQAQPKRRERGRKAMSRCFAGCASTPSCCRAASTPAPSW